MSQEQKDKIITLVSELRDAAIVYGSIAEKLQRGEYIYKGVVKARQGDLDNTTQAILDYLKTI